MACYEPEYNTCEKCGAEYVMGSITHCDECWNEAHPKCANCEWKGDLRCLQLCHKERCEEAGVEDICIFADNGDCHQPGADGYECQHGCANVMTDKMMFDNLSGK